MLITLRDMNEFAAAKMVHITTSIEYLEKAAWFHSPELGKWSPAEAQKVKTGLNGILEDLEFLSLGTTKAQCQRLVSEINTLNLRSLADRGAALRQTLNDELGSMAFLLIAPNELHYYTATTLLGEPAASRLRTANDEFQKRENALRSKEIPLACTTL